MRRSLLLGLALALAGCGGDGEFATSGDFADAGGGSGAPRTADLTIGTGFSEYEPVSDGETLEFVYGIQGGFHLWGGFEAEGLADGEAAIDFELYHDGELIGVAYYTDRLTADADGVTRYSAVSVAVTTDFQQRLIIPEDILGEDERLENLPTADFSEGPVTMTVRVEDAVGTIGTDEIDVIARCCSL